MSVPPKPKSQKPQVKPRPLRLSKKVFDDLFRKKDGKVFLRIDLIMKGQKYKKGEAIDYLDLLPESPENYYYLIRNSPDGKVLDSKLPIR